MMENIAENSEEQNNQASESPALSVGATLREAREKFGMSVEDVAAQIKLAPRQIEALEADDLSKLPEIAFVRGFIRGYAKILKLDVEGLLSKFHDTNQGSVDVPPPVVSTAYPDQNEVKKKNLMWLGLGGVLVVLVIVFAVKNYTDPVSQTKDQASESLVSTEKTTQNASEEPVLAQNKMHTQVEVKHANKATNTSGLSSVTPVKTPEPPTIIPLDLPPNPGELQVVFDDESWFEVKDRDGYLLVSRLYEPGSDDVISGNMPFTVLIGHASAARLYFDKQEVDLAPHTRTLTDVAHLTLE